MDGFQFHNGSIKSVTTKRTDAPSARRCFNSTMVRLKVIFGFGNDLDCLKFQFHNGSIKRKKKQVNRRYFDKVSIPQWFD